MAVHPPILEISHEMTWERAKMNYQKRHVSMPILIKSVGRDDRVSFC